MPNWFRKIFRFFHRTHTYKATIHIKDAKHNSTRYAYFKVKG